MKKILGIGNALVDIIYFLQNDELLNSFHLPKGSMQLVDVVKSKEVETAAGSCKKFMASGGSAANTIHGLSKLGMDTAFIGTVGKDSFGDFFGKDMKSCGIEPLLSLCTSVQTGRAISLVTPDGERTFATYLGAAIEIPADKLTQTIFSQYHHLHIEGYLVPNRELMEKVFELAANCNMSVSLDLASYNVVESNLSLLKMLVKKYRPIVFANEEEARSFTGFSDPQKALTELSSITDTAIVKTGSKGSLIYHKHQQYKIDPVVVNCIDTTGAGDLYAAGFLYGLMNDFTPERCGNIGSLLAGKVIEEAGAKISDDSWLFIQKALGSI